jgi:hypothetical protein
MPCQTRQVFQLHNLGPVRTPNQPTRELHPSTYHGALLLSQPKPPLQVPGVWDQHLTDDGELRELKKSKLAPPLLPSMQHCVMKGNRNIVLWLGVKINTMIGVGF